MRFAEDGDRGESRLGRSGIGIYRRLAGKQGQEKANMKVGTPVTILCNAGAVEKGTAGEATKFVGNVAKGQSGLYQGPVPGKLGKEGWHVVSLGAWDVPLHSSQFAEVFLGK